MPGGATHAVLACIALPLAHVEGLVAPALGTQEAWVRDRLCGTVRQCLEQLARARTGDWPHPNESERRGLGAVDRLVAGAAEALRGGDPRHQRAALGRYQAWLCWFQLLPQQHRSLREFWSRLPKGARGEVDSGALARELHGLGLKSDGPLGPLPRFDIPLVPEQEARAVAEADADGSGTVSEQELRGHLHGLNFLTSFYLPRDYGLPPFAFGGHMDAWGQW